MRRTDEDPNESPGSFELRFHRAFAFLYLAALLVLGGFFVAWLFGSEQPSERFAAAARFILVHPPSPTLALLTIGPAVLVLFYVPLWELMRRLKKLAGVEVHPIREVYSGEGIEVPAISTLVSAEIEPSTAEQGRVSKQLQDSKTKDG